MDSEIYFQGKKYISLKCASELTGYTSDYVGQLCRAKKINSRLVGRARYVAEDEILLYKDGPTKVATKLEKPKKENNNFASDISFSPESKSRSVEILKPQLKTISLEDSAPLFPELNKKVDFDSFRFIAFDTLEKGISKKVEKSFFEKFILTSVVLLALVILVGAIFPNRIEIKNRTSSFLRSGVKQFASIPQGIGFPDRDLIVDLDRARYVGIKGNLDTANVLSIVPSGLQGVSRWMVEIGARVVRPWFEDYGTTVIVRKGNASSTVVVQGNANPAQSRTVYLPTSNTSQKDYIDFKISELKEYFLVNANVNRFYLTRQNDAIVDLIGRSSGGSSSSSGGGTSNVDVLSDLSDISLGSLSYGDLLMYNGSDWINTSTSSLGITVDTSASSTLLADFNTWSGRNTFTSLLTNTYASSTYSSFSTASSTNLLTGFLTFATSTAGTLKTNSSGLVYVDASSGVAASSTLLSDSNTFSGTNNFTQKTGFASSTPWGLLSVNPNALGSGVPEFVIGSSTATHFIVDGGGNVGIGTANPARPLHVSGGRTRLDSGDDYPVELYRGGNISAYIGSGSDRNFRIFDGGGLPVFYINTIAGTVGNVGIGTSTPTAKLSVKGGGTTTGRAFAISDSADAEKFTVLDNGNVGIGTTGPVKKLTVDVTGSANEGLFIKGNTGEPGIIIGSAVGAGTAAHIAWTTAGLSIHGWGNNFGDQLFVQNSTGGTKVGIGNSAPLSKLGVTGNLSVGATYGVIAAPTSGMIIEGNVGIGTTTPGSLLSVGGDGTGTNFFDNATTSKSGVGGYNIAQGCYAINGTCLSAGSLGLTGTTGQVPYFSGTDTAVGTSSLFISTAQNVGIGTTNPGAKLDVVGGILRATGSGSGLVVGKRSDSSNAFQMYSDSGNLQFYNYTTGGDVVTILGSNSNVGIGATSPMQTLHVTSGTNYQGILINGNAAPSIGFVRSGNTTPEWKAGVSGTIGTSFSISKGASNDDKFIIDTNGLTGIGSTTPWGLLSVNPNALGSGVPEFVIGSSTATHFIVDGGGNVGIGTTTPGSLLDVNGTAQLRGANNGKGLTVNSLGFVGIGLTPPQVADSALVIWDDNNTAAGQRIRIGSGANVDYLIGRNTSTGFLDFTGSQTGFVGYTFNGNVGIGTTSPSAKLSVKGGGTTTGRAFAISDSADAEKFTVLDNGNVGIGTASPGTSLQIDEATSPRIRLSTSGTSRMELGYGPTGYGFTHPTGNYISLQSDLHIGQNASVNNWMTVQASTGNVGIGTTGPGYKLDVNGTVNSTAFRTTGALEVGSGNLTVSANATDSFYDAPSFTFRTTAGPTPRVTILNGGNVGIGTTAPDFPLHVSHAGSSSAFDTALRLENSTTATANGAGVGTDYVLKDSSGTRIIGAQIGAVFSNYLSTQRAVDLFFVTRPSLNGAVAERMRITGDGNVGIGTTSPSAKLQVANGASGGSSLPTTRGFLVTGTGIANGIATADGNKTGYIYTDGSTNTVRFDTYDYGGSTGLDLSLNGNGGNIIMNGSLVKVAVGTTTPLTKLHVGGGSVWIQGDSEGGLGTIGGKGLRQYYSASSDAAYLFAYDYGTNNSKNIILQSPGGNVGISTTSPSATLSVKGGGTTTGRAFAISDSADAEKFTVLDNGNAIITGNVGIGTTTPGAKLDVSGNIILSRGNAFQSYDTGGNARNIALLDAGNSLQILNAGGSSLGGDFYLGTTGTAGGSIFFQTRGNIVTTINTAGNVGIGTTNPQAKLDVNGIASSTTFYAGTGAVGAPSYAFAGDTGTGFYNQASGRVAVSLGGVLGGLFTNGVNQLRMNGGFGVTWSPADPSAAVADTGISRGAANKVYVGNGTNGDFTGTLIAGNVGIGTTTPSWLLNPSSATASQLALSAGAGISQWAFRNAGGNFYLGTTTVAGTATTSISALEIAGDGFGTTTLRGLNISGQATSTSNVGFNLTTGCYAVGGTCVGGGSGSSASSTLLTDSNTWSTGTNNFTAKVGFGSSTPWGQLSINPNALGSGVPVFVIGSSTATHLLMNGAGNIGLAGQTNPQAPLDIWKSYSAGTDAFRISYNDGTSYFMGIQPYVVGTGNVGYKFRTNNDVTATEALSITGDGKVGIGTSGPDRKLDILDASNPQLRLTHTDGSVYADLQGDSSGNLRFLPSGTKIYTFGKSFEQYDNSVVLQTLLDPNGNSYINSGAVGIGTTTPTNNLTIASTTGAQLSLSAGAGIAQWSFRNAGGNFYLGTTTVAGTATSSLAALEISGSGFGTTTVRGLNISSQATTTANIGFNISSGCYAVNGSCLSLAGAASTTLLTDSNTFSGANNFTGLINMTNKVGLASSTPWGLLSVNPDALGSNVPSFVVGSSTATRFIVANTGRVAVGNASPTTKAFEVNTTTDFDGALITSNQDNTQLTIRSTDTSGLGWNLNSTGGASGYGTGKFVITNSNSLTALMVIDSTGKVGIGRTDPGAALDVVGVTSDDLRLGGSFYYKIGRNTSTGYLEFEGTQGGFTGYNFKAGPFGINTASADRKFEVLDTSGPQARLTYTDGSVYTDLLTNSSGYFSIAPSGGRVGIGSTTPWGLLSVNPNALGSGAPEFVVGSSTATRLIVTGNGNVGIGTSNPQSKLHVSGGSALIENAGAVSLTLNDSSNSEVPALYFQQNGADVGSIRSGAGLLPVMDWYSGSTRIMRMGAGGYYGLAIGRNFSGNTTNLPYDGLTVEGGVGIGTSTPYYGLTVASTTGSQLALSAGTGVAQWAFRNAGGNFYLGTTTVAGTATTSISALEIAGDGFGTTTVRGLNISAQATSTSNVGFNITTGCYAVNGTCVGGGAGSGTVNSGVFGQLAFYGANGTALSGTSTITISTTTASGRVGIGTTTNMNATLTLQGAAGLDILNIATTTSGRNVITVSEWGGFVQRVSSTTALSIQMASGTPIFEVDTSSNTNSGIDITAGTGQTSNLMNLYSSGGTFLSGFTSAGGLHMNISSSSALDILNGSGVSAFMVDSSSKSVGIGTSTLTYNLNVEGSQASTYIARINNSSTNTSADGLLISLGVANASRTTSNYFIGFSDGAQTVAGKIQGGASAVAYTTSAADIAEYFRISNLTDKPKAGEIVVLDINKSQSVVRSHTDSNTEPLGIVSTNPGFIGNAPICFVDDTECDKNYAEYNVLVALAGQVPLKVTNENGPVVIGDYLTLSKTVPGAAMKAVESGYIVGTAITNASSTLIASTTSVVALVRSGWREINNGALVNSTASSTPSKFASLFDFLKGVGLEIGENFVKITNLITEKLVAKKVETEELCIGDTCVNRDQLAALVQMSGVVSITENMETGTSTPITQGTSTPIISTSTPPVITSTSTPEIISTSTPPVATSTDPVIEMEEEQVAEEAVVAEEIATSTPEIIIESEQ